VSDEPQDSADAPTVAPPSKRERPLARGSSIGRYLLLDPLGQGGMGVVYKAYDPELDRSIALKLLHASVDSPERLLREAQALARLQHQNVITVYDVGIFGANVFIAMEFVDGQTLRQWLKKEKRAPDEILSVFLAAGEGLAAAHKAGLVHRDFKPDNVMVGTDGRVRVLDFGLARTAGPTQDVPLAPGDTIAAEALEAEPQDPTVGVRRTTKSPQRTPPRPAPEPLPLPSDSGRISSSLLNSPLTHVGAIVGTPRFMAPEQQLNETIDERADQFSFCVSLYWALYGGFPFLGESQQDVLDAILTHQIAPTPAGSTVPRRLRQVLVRGLASRPKARFASMGELLAALRADPRVQRRRWMMAAALVALPILATAVATRIKRDQGAVCRGAERKLVGVWDPARRVALEQAFQRSGKPSAAEWFKLAAANLDGYAAHWTSERTEACEATRVHREQSEEVLDLRMACLDGRLREMQSLVSAIASGDADAMQEAPRATSRLGALEECADVPALRSPTPRPRDAQQRAQIETLEKRLADVQAFYNLGKLDAATSSSAALVHDAAALGFAPLLAKAHLWQGRTFADTYDGPKAISAFHSAFGVALGSGEGLIVGEAATRLAQEYVYARNKSESDAWYAIAEGALLRFPNPRRRAFLDMVRCVAISQDGKVRECWKCLQDHAAQMQRTTGLTDWELTWLGLGAADAGRFAESVEWVRRGVAYSAEHEGKSHPRTLELRAYLVRSLLSRGDTDEAVHEARDLVEVIRHEGLAGSALDSKANLYLGAALREQGKLNEAAAPLEQAHKETRDGEIKSEASPELVRLMLADGRAQKALPLALAALADERKSLSATHPYVLNDILALALAQAKNGHPDDARRTLEGALKDTAGADANPFLVAELKSDLAGVLPRSERERARTLTGEARQFYASEPAVPRFRDRVRKMDDQLLALR
jgi:serine/threonine protein kinase/tetratricopeptide (TPR) repeat protein